ncbi:hypothetical protein EYF80_060419 [Liparis tanakae]|uniref:Uncharacterized protein n=1 Tax=Liparis tanakae TaxID=230148 RepID=A0A4Z2EM53_9TELE|nr:hypothetical protein EYF80_060419 [Liparis tanakae]
MHATPSEAAILETAIRLPKCGEHIDIYSNSQGSGGGRREGARREGARREGAREGCTLSVNPTPWSCSAAEQVQ